MRIQNALLFEPDKCYRDSPADFHVTPLGKEITVASSARDQRLQVDSTLSFDEHITNTISSRLGSLCQINRVTHFLGTRTLGNVINALVFGKLHYLLNQPV